jgi:hypothetical protein
MSSALAPCLGAGQPDSQALAEPSETLADLCRRVAALERRFVKKRPDTTGRLRTGPDRCPFGWKPHPRNPAMLVEDAAEQQTIFRLVELATVSVSFRELCRRLDAAGCKRRGG